MQQKPTQPNIYYHNLEISKIKAYITQPNNTHQGKTKPSKNHIKKQNPSRIHLKEF